MSTLPTDGRLGHLTPQQSQTLDSFKSTLHAKGVYTPDSGVDDHTLLRFLRARKFDLEASTTMWMDYMKWRKEYGTDEV